MGKEIEEREKESLLIYLNEIVDSDPKNEEGTKSLWDDNAKVELKQDLNRYFFEDNQENRDVPEYLLCNIS